MIRHRALQWTGIGAGLTALLAALLLAGALGSPAAAQDGGVPDPPAWFWGRGFDSDNGSMIRAMNQDGEEIGSASISGGTWSLLVAPSAGDSATLEIQTGGTKRATGSFPLQRGKLTAVTPSDFTVVAAPPPPAVAVGVRVIARVSDNPGREGQIEFGLYVDGVDAPIADYNSGAAEPMFLPPQRYFPAELTHNRWLRSTRVEVGDGVFARVIARVSDNPGREGQIEFGLYVDGVDAPIADYNSGAAEPMFLPPQRYFPNPAPNHNRWLRSTVVEVPPSP